MEKTRSCAICGVTSDSKLISTVYGMPLCAKHKAQFYRHGKITDPTPRTAQDKNQIIMHDTYAELIIYKNNNSKKYVAIIDIDDVEKVKQHKWRYETHNKTDIGYVVSGNSKNRLRLHKYVIGYDGNLQIDHINRNTLDNRKQNLRVVPAVINSHNRETHINKNIVRTEAGKYKVKITRFRRVFLFGEYETSEEARLVRDEFLAFVKENEKLLTYNYCNEDKEKHSHKNHSTTFSIKGRMQTTTTYKTVAEAINNRPDLKELLKPIQKTA